MRRIEELNIRHRRIPNVDDLTFFEAASRHVSFVDAAVELGVSTQKLRSKLEKFQRDMKVSLFDNDKVPIALTEAGQLYRGRLGDIFEDIYGAIDRLRKHEVRGHLTIAAGSTLGSLWLMPRLQMFKQQWPNIRLALALQPDDCAAGGDLQITFATQRPEDMSVQLCASVQLFPVCCPALISSRSFNEIGDLEHFTLLHCDRGEEWRKWLGVAKGGSLHRYNNLKFPNALLAVEAAIRGHGVALASHITVSHLLNAGKLIVPFRESVFSPNQMYITTERAVPSKDPSRTFVAWASEQLKDSRKNSVFDSCK